MTTRQYFCILLLVSLTTVLLASVWEFWLEDLSLALLSQGYIPESLSVRWEYVITVSVFSGIALIVPALVGCQFIARQKADTEKLISLAETDHLTGLYNRRKLTELIEEELARHRRFQHGLSVILLDTDRFKAVNDTEGHAAGDWLLKEISARITGTIRDVDMAGRWGGDEFLVVCPETDLQGAMQLAEKLRANIAEIPFGSLGTLTISCGVAAAETQDVNAESLINRADKALYAAKDTGRNRVANWAELATTDYLPKT